MYHIETIEYKGHNIIISNDSDSESPRNWDNLGSIIAFHNRYTFSDTENKNMTIEDATEIAQSKKFICMPIFMYEHSGIALSLSNTSYPFNDRWDSGQLGFIFCSKNKALKEFNKKRVSKKLKEQVINIFRSEIDMYSSYINGEIYSIDIDDEPFENSIYGIDYLQEQIKYAKQEIDKGI